MRTHGSITRTECRFFCGSNPVVFCLKMVIDLRKSEMLHEVAADGATFHLVERVIGTRGVVMQRRRETMTHSLDIT